MVVVPGLASLTRKSVCDCDGERCCCGSVLIVDHRRLVWLTLGAQGRPDDDDTGGCPPFRIYCTPQKKLYGVDVASVDSHQISPST